MSGNLDDLRDSIIRNIGSGGSAERKTLSVSDYRASHRTSPSNAGKPHHTIPNAQTADSSGGSRFQSRGHQSHAFSSAGSRDAAYRNSVNSGTYTNTYRNSANNRTGSHPNRYRNSTDSGFGARAGYTRNTPHTGFSSGARNYSHYGDGSLVNSASQNYNSSGQNYNSSSQNYNSSSQAYNSSSQAYNSSSQNYNSSTSQAYGSGSNNQTYNNSTNQTYINNQSYNTNNHTYNNSNNHTYNNSRHSYTNSVSKYRTGCDYRRLQWANIPTKISHLLSSSKPIKSIWVSNDSSFDKFTQLTFDSMVRRESVYRYRMKKTCANNYDAYNEAAAQFSSSMVNKMLLMRVGDDHAVFEEHVNYLANEFILEVEDESPDSALDILAWTVEISDVPENEDLKLLTFDNEVYCQLVFKVFERQWGLQRLDMYQEKNAVVGVGSVTGGVDSVSGGVDSAVIGASSVSGDVDSSITGASSAAVGASSAAVGIKTVDGVDSSISGAGSAAVGVNSAAVGVNSAAVGVDGASVGANSATLGINSAESSDMKLFATLLYKQNAYKIYKKVFLQEKDTLKSTVFHKLNYKYPQMQPTKVLLLYNMVSIQDLKNEDSYAKIKRSLDLQRAGLLAGSVQIEIPRPGIDMIFSDVKEHYKNGLTKIFVKFDSVEKSVAAFERLSGWCFQGRRILLGFYNEQDFEKGIYI